MAVNYDIVDSIMVPADKLASSGVKVNYTYRTNFNDWVLNTGKGHEIEISEDGNVLTIKKFHPHFWIVRSPQSYQTDEWNQNWQNWKFKVSGLENAVSKITDNWRIYGNTNISSGENAYYMKGLVVSPLLAETTGEGPKQVHREWIYFYPWDYYPSGYCKYPNGGWNNGGYRSNGDFNFFNKAASLYYNNKGYCSIGIYGNNTWTSETQTSYLSKITFTDGTIYYETDPGIIDVSDNPVVITLLPSSCTEEVIPEVNYEKECWKGFIGSQKVWSKDKTVENCLKKYDGEEDPKSTNTFKRILIGKSLSAKKDPIFIDDGLCDTNRDPASSAHLYRYNQINHTSNASWVGDAYFEESLSAPYKLPSGAEIVDLDNYTPYNLCFNEDGEINGNMGYLSWLNNFYASNKSPFIEGALDVTDPTTQSELKAEYDSLGEGGEHFCIKEINNPFIDHLYLDNDATTPLNIHINLNGYFLDKTTNTIKVATQGRTFYLAENGIDGRPSMTFGSNVKKVNHVNIYWEKGENHMPQHFFSGCRKNFGTINFIYSDHYYGDVLHHGPDHHFGLSPLEMDNTFSYWPFTTLNMNGSTTEVPTNTWEGTDYMYWKGIEKTQYAFDNASNLRVIDVRTDDNDTVEWIFGSSCRNGSNTSGTNYQEIDYYDQDNNPVYKTRWPFKGLGALYARASMAQMCGGCSNLVSIKPILNVKYLFNSYAFHGGTGTYDAKHAFNGCSNLEEVYLKNIDHFDWNLTPLKKINTASITYLFNNAVDLVNKEFDEAYKVPRTDIPSGITLDFDWKHCTSNASNLKVTFATEAKTALDAVSSSVKAAFRAKGWKIYLGNTEYTS